VDRRRTPGARGSRRRRGSRGVGGDHRVGAGPLLQEARVRATPLFSDLLLILTNRCFTRSTDTPLNQETQYTPTDKDELTRNYLMANRLFSPMLALLEFLSSRFQAFRYRSAELVHASLLFVLRLVSAHKFWRCAYSPLPWRDKLRLTDIATQSPPALTRAALPPALVRARPHPGDLARERRRAQPAHQAVRRCVRVVHHAPDVRTLQVLPTRPAAC